MTTIAETRAVFEQLTKANTPKGEYMAAFYARFGCDVCGAVPTTGPVCDMREVTKEGDSFRRWRVDGDVASLGCAVHPVEPRMHAHSDEKLLSLARAIHRLETGIPA